MQIAKRISKTRYFWRKNLRTFSINATARRASIWQSSGRNAAPPSLPIISPGSSNSKSWGDKNSALSPASDSWSTLLFNMAESLGVLPINKLPIHKNIKQSLPWWISWITIIPIGRAMKTSVYQRNILPCNVSHGYNEPQSMYRA